MRRLGLGFALTILPALAQHDLNQLSADAAAKGRYDEAKSLALKGVERFRSTSDRQAEADAWTNLGKARIYSGEYQQGEAAFLEALRLAREKKDAEIEVSSLTNLGVVYYFLGRYGEAFDSYQSAQRTAAGQSGATWFHRRNSLILVNKATLHQRLGQDSEALALYKSAQDSVSTLTTQEQASLLMNLGVCYRRLGDPAKAMEAFQAAEKLFRQRGDLYGELYVRKNQGILLALDMGDLEKAGALFERNAADAQRAGNRRELLQSVLYAGEALFQRRLLKPSGGRFAAALELARQLGTKEEEWKALYGLGRVAAREGRAADAVAHYRDAVAVIESLRSAVSLAPLRSEFLADKVAVYDALIELRLNEAGADELFGLVESSRARTFQDRLGGEQAKLDRLRERLPADTALISYWLAKDKGLRIQVTGSGVHRQSFRFDPDKVSSLRKRLLERNGDGWKEDAAALGVMLLSGLDTASLRHLIIVPDTELEAVPFEVLQKDGRALLDTVAVSYAPASALLARPPRTNKTRWPWQMELSAFADPRFVSDEASPAGRPFAPLPGSADEARAAAAALPGRASLFLGADNQKRHFLNPLTRQVPLLHIATHAVADTSNPERSHLLFSSALTARPDPLYLRQLSELDMRGVDLAVLSACDTEVGRNPGGEGSQTMGRAIIAAGSRSVITTLWRVEDQSTSFLMRNLYESLARGNSKAESLRLAKLALRDKSGAHSHPGYWAPFLLLGDGEDTIPLPVPVWMFPAGLLATAAVGYGSHFWWSRINTRATDPGMRMVNVHVR